MFMYDALNVIQPLLKDISVGRRYINMVLI